MSKLKEIVEVTQDEKPFVDFESSLDNGPVVSGYVPVKSTLDAFQFLQEATGTSAPSGRAVVCWGSYGSGKSRLAAVIARLFRDGFDCPALQPVWQRLEARGESERVNTLRSSLLPGGRAWHPWLVVPMYAQAGGGTLSGSLIRSLVKALRRSNIDESVLGNTVYQAAADRLDEMLNSGATYTAAPQSTFATAEQLRRALVEDLDEQALAEFGLFHKSATHGVGFQDYLQASGGAALHAHEVYNQVARAIQPHGYDGIIVLWDEFGFAIEELLRDANRGVRSLGQETIALQNFVEKSCGSLELGNRVVFMGFTHVGVAEYGTREHLAENDQNRLVTVDARFRKPDINIRLSVTETEGYHLLSGMLRRTARGQQVFSNPVPKLQRLADQMRGHRQWERMSADVSYSEIAAPCYPIHPASAAALLTLSDQIAQVNRTTFYFLQNREEGGLAGVLDQRDLPPLEQLGGDELVRVSDLYPFFEQAIRSRERVLADQYDEALIRFPDPSIFEQNVFRTVLVLTVARISPTTKLLAFCLCDSSPSEPGAQPLHEALGRLSGAQALWKNEATDVWSFVGNRGLGADIDREIEDERTLVSTCGPCALLRNSPEIQAEIADRLGDFDLDPSDSGIVRRVSVQILKMALGEAAVEKINPAVEDAAETWRAAIVYLIVPDTQAELTFWRQRSAAMEESDIYFVFPTGPVQLGTELRDLVAVRQVLGRKASGTHAYEVLEGRLTKLRNDLRRTFSATFGNVGLRSGTVVVKAGPSGTTVPVDSWNELLPAIGLSVDQQFSHQIRVRCGKFNEWQDASNWGAITRIVERIISYDENPQYQTQFLGFQDTSQEAAIVDGVLIENGWLKEEALSGRWSLIEVSSDTPDEVLKETARHFQSGGSGDKEFTKLFARLIDSPFGIPNGIIPLVCAVVLRADLARIAVYVRSGAQSQRVTNAQLPEAIVNMAKRPDQYQTRYSKLSGRQRVVFKAIGPEMGVTYSDREAVGELFYGYCERVRKELKQWVSLLTDGVLKLSELTDAQRTLLKSLRSPVMPHLSALADQLVAVISEDQATHSELTEATADTTSFPIIVKFWRDWRARVDRHVEGVRAPLRSKLRDLADRVKESPTSPDVPMVDVLQRIEGIMNVDSPIRAAVQRLQQPNSSADTIDDIAAAVSGKPPTALTDEDYGRAVGVIEMASVFQQIAKQFAVVLPSGERRTMIPPASQTLFALAESDIEKWRNSGQLSTDDLASLALCVIYGVPLSGKVLDGSEGEPSGQVHASEQEAAPADTSSEAGNGIQADADPSHSK